MSESLTLESGPENIPNPEFAEKIGVMGRAIGLALSSVEKSFPYNNTLWELMYKGTIGAAASILRQVTGAEMKANCPENIKFSENIERRSFVSILTEAIDLFENSEAQWRVTWQEECSRLTINEISKLLNSSIDLSFFPDPSEQERYARYMGKPFFTLLLAEPRTKNFIKTAIYNNVDREIFSKIANAERTQMFGSDESDNDEQNINEYFDREIGKMEIWLGDKFGDPPYSVSKIISYCLLARGGSLNLALEMASGILKYLSRGHGTESGSLSSSVIGPSDVSHFVNFVKDEFSAYVPWGDLSDVPPVDKRPNNNLDKKYDESDFARDIGYQKGELTWDHEYFIGLEIEGEPYMDYARYNRIGLAYHAVHIASLLSSFSPEAISVLVGGEYALHGPQHGKLKLQADLQVLADLYDIHKILGKYGPQQLTQ